MVFVLLGQDEQEVAPCVEAAFSGNYLKIGPGQWLLSATCTSTSKEIWTKLVTGRPKQPLGIVFPITGQFGYASSSVWEWIAAKRQAETA